MSRIKNTGETNAIFESLLEDMLFLETKFKNLLNSGTFNDQSFFFFRRDYFDFMDLHSKMKQTRGWNIPQNEEKNE